MATQQLVVFNAFYEQNIMNEADWLSLPIHTLLLRNDGPGNGGEWFSRTLADKKDPATLSALWGISYQAVEIDSTNYARQTLTPQNITIDTDVLDRGTWNITQASTVYGNPIGDATQQTIEGVLIYTGSVSSANDGTNIPLLMQEYAVGKPTADGPVTANWSTNGLWFMTQA